MARVHPAASALAATMVLAMIVVSRDAPATPAVRRASAARQAATTLRVDVLRAGAPRPGPRIRTDGPAATRIDTASVTAASGAAKRWCRDTSYALERWKVAGGFSWYYNGRGAPAGVAASAVAAAGTATRAMAAGRNDCGWTRPFRVTERYMGASRAAVGVSAAGTCSGDDGRSVVGWRRLSGDALAITCTYYDSGNGHVVSSDVAINTKYRWFTTRPSRCSGSFDLIGVLTHERGHTFGLAHVSPYRHPGQTMVTSIAACSVGERTLGGGDYAGMRSLYGLR